MASLSELFNTARIFGLRKVLLMARYSLFRERLDRRYSRQLLAAAQQTATPPGNLLQASEIPNGAHFDFEKASLEIVFLTADVARLTWTPGPLPLPYGLARAEWIGAAANLSRLGKGWILSSPELKIEIASDGALLFTRADGRPLYAQHPPIWQGDPQSPAWTAVADLAPEECIYGLGEKAWNLNRRGTKARMWNTDPYGAYGHGDDPIYMPMPVYLGLHLQGCYLAFYENYHPAVFEFDPFGQKDSSPQAHFSFEAGALRYYLISADLPRLIERFSELTGRPNLPPLWSLGYHQSRWGYKTEKDIREVAQGFRQHQMPLSAIHLDIDYMDGFRIFTVDPQRFPDLGKLADELQAEDVKLVAIIDPGVKRDPNYFFYQQGMRADAFLKLADGRTLEGVVWPGTCVYPDFTKPAARQWWGQAYQRLLDQGIAGFWHDMNEPTSFAISHPYLPLETRHDMEGQGGDHRAGHNLYALQMNRAGYESLRRAVPEKRPWLISRAGWVSQQRYSWNWTGDTRTSWESLRLTIPLVIGSGLSGQPYNGPDIGGFSGQPSAELYTRWLQMAAFLPFFRTHSVQGAPRREPWVFGEPYTSLIRRYLQLRYRLLPYLYTLAWQANQSGYPLIRPLFWDDPHDPQLWQIEDQFLLGDALLVAPLVEEGQSSRSVFLPKGEWVDLWTDQTYSGGQTVHYSSESAQAGGLGDIPIFVRAGSLLPLQILSTTGQKDGLALHLYPPEVGRVSRQVVYSDSGDGYGDWRLDRFQIQRNKQQIDLNWRSEGAFPFPHPNIRFHLHAVPSVSSVGCPIKVDGTSLQIPANDENLPDQNHPGVWLWLLPFEHLEIETIS